MPSAAAQGVLQAILERRAAEKRRTLGAAAAPMVLPFANSRIAEAFEAAKPVRQVDELSAPITLPFAARNQLGDWGPRMPNVLKTIADPRTSPFGPAAVARLFMDPAGEVGRQVETGEQLAKPFTQFNDPNVDPVKQAADLALTAMGGSAAVPAEVNSLRMGASIRDPRLWSEFSGIKSSMPVDEMTATYGAGKAQLPEKAFDWGTVKEGDVFVPLTGDRTLTGPDLLAINGKEFRKPVASEGGAGYTNRADNPQDTFWASDPAVIGRLQNQIRPLQEEGRNVFGATVAMGPHSGDYSMQTTRTALEMLRKQRLPKDAREILHSTLDERMKADWGKDFPAVADWPGIGSKKLTEEYLKGAGKARTKLAKLLDTAEMRKLGAPDMAAVRKAVTDPKQVGSPFLGTGRHFTQLSGEATHVPRAEVLDPHNTYVSQLRSEGSQPAGSLPKLVYGPEFWTDFFGGKSGNESQLGYAFMRSPVFQRATPEWIEKVAKLGLAGAVGAGLITNDQLREIFAADGSAPQQSPQL